MGEQQPYTIAEVAAMTGFSPQTVTRLFEKEPGVLILARPEQKHKRRYRSFRIPRSVYERVIRGVSVK
jgi:AraC-like DNA-binding protein